MKFVERVLAGEEFKDAIDDYVKEWHESSSCLELHDYLGLTFEQYALWVENPDTLDFILFSIKEGQEIPKRENSDLHLLAARSQVQPDANGLNKWLKDNGYLQH